jgi:hypothetical protein
LSAALWPLQRDIEVVPESLDKTPLQEGLSNGDERDEGKEEKKDER